MIKTGIVGGAGYTAGELLRILIRHPETEISFVHSISHAGQPVWAVHKDLRGETGLVFTDELSSGVDVLYLCGGHNKAIEFLQQNVVPAQVRIIDLSQDFRINHVFEGNSAHREFVYGLPELNKAQIVKARNIANPGCFATAFELALLPLATAGLLKEDVHINGITGATGAGQSLTDTTHFSWRTNNISVYKAFAHQHLKEVQKTLEQAQQAPLPKLNFLPVRGNFSRGIFLSAYTKCGVAEENLVKLYQDFYRDAAFTFVANEEISMKEVINTNKCLLRVEKHGDLVLITSVIDNLTKGASGQAVQNMNLMFGLPEKTGLSLKAIAF